MKLILLNNYKKYNKGDLITESDGYGENFLIPNGIARKASILDEKKFKKNLDEKKIQEFGQNKKTISSLELILKQELTWKLERKINSKEIAKFLKAKYQLNFNPTEIKLEKQSQFLIVHFRNFPNHSLKFILQ